MQYGKQQGKDTDMYPWHNFDSRAKPDNGAISNRLRTFVGGRYSQWNLSSLIYAHKRDDIEIVCWDAPGRSKPTFDEAKKELEAGNGKKISTGHKFGPSWTQHWLKVTIPISSDWRKNDQVEFIFDPSCEAMILDSSGTALQGITGGFDYNRRVEYIIPHKEVVSGKCIRYIEVSANGMFGAGPQDDVRDDKYYTLETVAVGAVDLEARRLSWDFELLAALPEVLPQQSPLGNKARALANKIMNTFDGTLNSVRECRQLAEDVMGKGWQEDANKQTGQEEGTLWALGYCHIDTAWLWPWSATQQKVARTWSSQIEISDRYPEFRFFASAAQHYKWLEEFYPAVFDKVKQKIKDKKFDVNGGCWVEMDGNLPSGESLARQFVHGQKYFKSRFGITCDVLVLPDTFGFGPQIPQIARLSGCPNFFTHKLNWSLNNEFPLTTFNWVGLDGTQLLSHITPIQRYDSDCTLPEIMKGYSHHKNLDVSNESLLMFGNGDGGGGPSAVMLERLRRTRAAGMHSDRSGEQLPLVKTGFSLSEFFEHTRKQTDNGKSLPAWVGELYLERHRAVQTSQSRTKRNFRVSEHLIREAEYISTLASIQTRYSYHKERFDNLWESLCLCMFHDTLPGSSIHLAVEDYDRKFAAIHKTAKELFEEGLKALAGGATSTSVLNTLPSHPRKEIVMIGDGELRVAEMDAHTLVSKAEQHELSESEGVTVYKKGDSIKMSNANLDVVITKGRITSLFDKAEKREIIPEGKSAGFMIFKDMPHDADVWELYSYTLDVCERLEAECQVAEKGPLRGAVECTLKYGQSTAKISISLDALPASLRKDARSMLRFDCHIDWHERHRLLKFELPLDLWAQEATYDVAFGVTKRPTHRNTSWDAAKFEVPAHKFADYSEYGYGVALINDCKYGYSTQGNTMTLSLLRGPTEPDPEADQGKQEFSFGIYPHLGTYECSDVQQVAHAFNNPLKVIHHCIASDYKLAPFTLEGSPNIMLETIKRGESDFDAHSFNEEGTKTVILRLHENMGGRGVVKLSSKIHVSEAAIVNILEDHVEELDVVTDLDKDVIDLTFKAFEIKTVMLSCMLTL